MAQIKRIILAFCLLAALLVCGIPKVSAERSEKTVPSMAEASAVYFYHLESGQLIGGKNETRQLPAGSTVKVLSGLLACERLESLLAETVEITQDMIANSSGNQYRLQAGELYTVEELLYLALCGSYNDAYDVLAYLAGGGDLSQFIAMMNQRAQELGTQNTHVQDVSGVADNSLTTAEDLFLIARAAVENPLYMRLTSAESYILLSGHRIYNRNALISRGWDSRYYNHLCRGLSAGTTTLGGCSLVTLAQSGNDRYICVVLGGMEGAEQENPQNYAYIIANRLIKWGFDNYRYVEVLSPEKELCTIGVKVSDVTSELSVRPTESLYFYLPADVDPERDLTYSIRLLYDELEAPVTDGMHVGYVAVSYEGRIIGTVNLCTVGGAERSGFVNRLMQIKNLTENRGILAGGIFFLAAIVAWILTEYFLARHRRHKWDKYFSQKIDIPKTILKRR